MEDWELGWLAGVFEGEGSITYTGRVSVRVSLGMTDQDVVESFNRLFPAGNTYRYERKNRIKPLYVWRIDNRDGVKRFLELVLPYLHARRKEKAIGALERLKRNRGAKGLRTHCPRGHPLSGDNLYVKPDNGTRSCHTCRVRVDRERVPRRVPPSECVCERCGKTFFARRGTRWCSQRCRHSSWRDRRRAQGLPV